MALGSSSAAHHFLHQGVTSQGPLFTQASTQGWSGEISNKIRWSSSHHRVTFVFLVSYFLFFLFLVSFFLVSNFYCHRDIIPSPNYCSQGAADVIVNLGSTTTSYCFTKIISSIIIFKIIINPQWRDGSISVLQSIFHCPHVHFETHQCSAIMKLIGLDFQPSSSFLQNMQPF